MSSHSSRRKASATLRRLSIQEKKHARHASQAWSRGELEKASMPSTAEQNINALEFFTQDRFEQCRDHRGEYLSRYNTNVVHDWRMENRMRTISCLLCSCLNIGVPPPDSDGGELTVAWHHCVGTKSMESVSASLQSAYEFWQPKAAYKPLMDPTAGDVKKLCMAVRKTTRERILFHYNGHGVPRPTANGEMWVFNKDFTQYIPLSIYDLLSWLSGPCIIVLDCSNSSILLPAFHLFLQNRAREEAKSPMPNEPAPYASECILLAACQKHESLPVHPQLPSDLFTACLTTPLRASLRHALLTTRLIELKPGTIEYIENLPGKIADRKTPLGELNWIFTAITDTIAYQLLDKDTFQKLFRQDLLVASLFRNFLLANRIMRHYHCTPVSHPVLPSSHKHPLWSCWDHCVEQVILAGEKQRQQSVEATQLKLPSLGFFNEHLMAFEVWLDLGPSDLSPPLLLPIVLQVLLSQSHRRRALHLLARFLAKGTWAVRRALEVGIFPYVLKLLSSPAQELREVLIFIWSKLLSVDRSCANDLLTSRAMPYFLSHLASATDRAKTMSCFIFSCLIDKNIDAQRDAIRGNLLSTISTNLESPYGPLRRWICLLLGKLWQDSEEVRTMAIHAGLPDKLIALLNDMIPDVRCAAIFALSCLLGGIDRVGADLQLGKSMSLLASDMDHLVREELVVALGLVVEGQKEEFTNLINEHGLHMEPSGISTSVSVPPSPSHGSSSGGFQFHLNNNILQLKDSQPSSNNMQASPSLGPSNSALYPPPSPSTSISGASPASGSVAPVALNRTVSEPVYNAQKPQGLSAAYLGKLTNAPSMNNSSSPLSPPQIQSRESSDSYGNNFLSPPSTTRTLSNSVTSSPQKVNSLSPLRLIIWNAIKSLCSDPFPSVSRAASSLRQVMVSRGFATSTTPRAGHHSITASPILGSVSVIQESADDSPTLDSHPNAALTSSHSSLSSASHSNHMASDAPTRPRSRPVSELDYHYPDERATSPASHHNSNPQSTSHSQSSTTNPSPNPSPLASPTITSTGMKRAVSYQHTSKLVHEIKIDTTMLSFSQTHLSKSNIYDRSCDSFITRDDSDDLESILIKEWRRKRNADYIKYASSIPNELYDQAERGTFDQIAALTTNMDSVNVCLFHPFENMLVVADKRNVCVWDYKEMECFNTFMNDNNRSGKICHLTWLNDESVSLLLVGSDDGVVRVWRGAHTAQPELVSAWTAAPRSTHKTPMCIDWQKSNGQLLSAGGNTIKVWDLEHGISSTEVFVDGDTHVTSMTSTAEGGLIFAGCGDGTVRLYDVRADTHTVQNVCKFSSSVVNVQVQRMGDDVGKLVAGSVGGELLLSDPRCFSSSFDTSVFTSVTPFEKPHILDTFSVHPYAPLIACGTRKQVVQITDFKNNPISTLKYHKGFMGHRIGPVNHLQFHPHKLVLAAASSNPYVSIMAAIPPSAS